MTQGRAHRILATDLDQEALDQAQTGGPYSAAETRNLTRWMQLKYFEATPSGLAAKDSLKRMVQFQRHNLLTDPFEGNFDLILCRNVVIYLSEGTKNALNQRLVRSLRNGGWLFIGGAETLTHFHELGLERLHTCMYQKSTAMAGAHTPAVTAV
jgi:chemotaxis protein methyltransferase CheR